MKLRWNVAESSMTSFSLLCVNEPLPKNEWTPATSLVFIVRFLISAIEGLSRPVEFNDQRNFVADERVRGLVELGPDPQLEAGGVGLRRGGGGGDERGLVQGAEGGTDAVQGGIVYANMEAFHLEYL